jgi:ribonuclease E
MLGPAVSLWHKIFGSPADQSAKIEEISSRQDEQEVTSDVREERSMPRDSNFDRDLADDDVVEAPAQDDIEPGIESEQDERGDRRPRRTRRRRRGRGGKDEPTSDGGSRVHRKPHRADDVEARGELDQGDDDEDDSHLDIPADDENGMADDGDSTEAGTSRAARSRAALQRSIPSWDEAIGFIVDVNMQSRSQRRQSGHGSSPRGRSRGRRKN